MRKINHSRPFHRFYDVKRKFIFIVNYLMDTIFLSIVVHFIFNKTHKKSLSINIRGQVVFMCTIK